MWFCLGGGCGIIEREREERRGVEKGWVGVAICGVCCLFGRGLPVKREKAVKRCVWCWS